mgnify:CR=1 FL=1
MPLLNHMIFVLLIFLALGGFNALLEAQERPLVAGSAERKLTILNWDDYLDPALVKKFEQQHRVSISQSLYESDDHRDLLMKENQGQGWDLVIVSGLMVEAYFKQGWLASKPLVENDPFINVHWTDAFSGAKDYVVPYFWGTLGIAYRNDLVSQPITHWRQFFNPGSDLKGKISLINSSRDVVGMALKSLGHSANSHSDRHLLRVHELLLSFRSSVHTLHYIDLDERSLMLTGEVVAAMMYSGDTLMLQEHNPNITYILPQEGGNIWVDYIGVLSSSKQQELAWQFIRFINKPENAAQLAQYINYATPNTEAQKLLPADFVDNTVIYPSKDALKKSEYYKVLPKRTRDRYNKIFSLLK